jgi:hypothetical protein
VAPAGQEVEQDELFYRFHCMQVCSFFLIAVFYFKLSDYSILQSRFLIDEKYSKPSLMAASGSSAGGLLLGAVLNMQHRLFKAMVLKVPYLDGKEIGLLASYFFCSHPSLFWTSLELYD